MKLLRRIRNSITGRWELWRFRPYVIDRTFAGESFRFKIGDLFGARSYGMHRNHWPELDWIKAKAIRPGDTVVDCGANHGFSTLLFSRWAGPTGKVHAIEPNQHNVDILAGEHSAQPFDKRGVPSRGPRFAVAEICNSRPIPIRPSNNTRPAECVR